MRRHIFLISSKAENPRSQWRHPAWLDEAFFISNSTRQPSLLNLSLLTSLKAAFPISSKDVLILILLLLLLLPACLPLGSQERPPIFFEPYSSCADDGPWVQQEPNPLFVLCTTFQ